MPNCITRKNDCREQKSYLVLFRRYFSCLKVCYFRECDCALTYCYTHSQWFCIDSAGFDSQCMSCVRISAFLHVFYVSYMSVIFCVVCVCVCMHICVRLCACTCSMYACERVCLCLCSLFKIMMFSIWEMGSEKVILWDTVCCCGVVRFEFMLYDNAASWVNLHGLKSCRV